MRVWDIHPGYLTRKSLLGQHVEIHALYSVITGGKKGYANHPETLRWQGRLEQLKHCHDLTVKEMALRGYRHSSPIRLENLLNGNFNPPSYVDHPAEQFEILRSKYEEGNLEGRIPLPKRGSEFWAHHKYSVMARGYNLYKEVQAFLKNKVDLPIHEEKELVEKIQSLMEKPVDSSALANTANHLWGYFKDKATAEEKDNYLHCPQEKLSELTLDFYCMAQKYNQKYLLHSTIFADFLEQPT